VIECISFTQTANFGDIKNVIYQILYQMVVAIFLQLFLNLAIQDIAIF
jgi:hypothetical protein